MADLQNAKRQGTEQTWKEAYQDVDKTVASLRDLNEDFASFVADYNEFSDDRKQRFQDYLDSLDDVSLHWEEINDWVKKNSDTADTYVGSLSNIRSIFQSIVSEIQGAHRQVAERLGVVRQFSRVANDSLLAVQQEGGLNNRVVQGLDKKVKAARLYYNAQLGQLGAQLDSAGNLISTEEELTRLQRAELARAKVLSAEIQHQEDLSASGIRIDRYRLKALRDELQLRETNAEILGKVTRDAVGGLEKQIERQKELFRIQRQGGSEAGKNAMPARRVTVASKFLSKFGLRDSAQTLERDYGRFVTDRVSATQRVELANERKEATAKTYKNLKDDYAHKLEKKSDAAARLSKIAQKEKELEEANLRFNLAQNTLKSLEYDPSVGRDRKKKTGKFVKSSVADKAFNESVKAAKEAKNLEKQIKDLKKAQADFTRSLASSAAAVQAAKLEAEGAAKEVEEAKTNENQVYERKFNLVEKIKDSIGDLSGLLRYIGGLLAVAMWRQLLKVDEEAVKTKRVIGQWADASALANTKFVTGTEVLKTMRDLGEQFHINPVQVFSTQELARISQAQKLTGMTAEAAGNLAVQSKITGKNADTYRDSIADGAYQSRLVNKQAISLSAVQNDVLNTSRAIALSYGNNVEGLARAAGAAAALGTNLQGVEEIAKNLMNFESSIESEMQAQLLTGMQLNLAKAREYALNNDLEGVAREVGRQGMDAAKFSHMNYIQQENMAKALGMSREQMSKMLIMQEISKGLSAEEIANRTGMKRQDIEALSAQEKWQTMKQRFLESLVPLLEPVLQVTSDIFRLITPLLGIISTIAGWISRIFNIIPENWVYLRSLVGIIAIAIPAALLRGVSIVGLFKRGLTGIVGLGTKIGKSFANWAVEIGKAEGAGGKLKALFSKLGPQRDYQGRTARQRLRDIRKLDKAKEINPAGAAATSKASASMGSTVSKLGKNMGNILKGAAAAVLIAGAVFILAKAAQEFMKVSWGGILKAVAGLVVLIGAVAAVGAIMSSGVGTVLVLAGAAAMVVMAGAVALLGLALKQFEGIDLKTIGKLPVAMLSLAAAGALALIAGPALALGAPLLLAGSIALLAASLPFSLALRSLTVVDGSRLIAFAEGISQVAVAVKDLAESLRGLNMVKFAALTAVSTVGSIGSAIASRIARPKEPATPKAEVLGESKENPRENIEAAVQNIVIKQAEIRASAQRISVEQKAADLSKIEKKLDNVITAIKSATPTDWNWLEFNRTQTVNA